MIMKQVSALVEDFGLYPRVQVDSHHVAEIVEVIHAGIELPPIVIDKKSLRIIDGMHRSRAYRRIDPDMEVACIPKTYRTDKAMFIDAMKYNANHGRNLTVYDRTHCIILAETFKISEKEVAVSLNYTVDRIVSLKKDRTATTNGTTISLKNTIKHMAGKKLTKRQKEGNEKLSGMNQMFYVNQLIELIEADLLDRSDEKLMARLAHLKTLL